LIFRFKVIVFQIDKEAASKLPFLLLGNIPVMNVKIMLQDSDNSGVYRGFVVNITLIWALACPIF